MIAFLLTPSMLAFVATVVVISGIFALRSQARLSDLSTDAGAIAGLVYFVIDMILHGPNMLSFMWLVGLFVVCVPLTFLAGLAWRVILHRPLNAFHDGRT